MGLYEIKNPRLQNFLIENGLQPVEEYAETAIFVKSKELQRLLDLYWINYNIFKR